LPAPAPVVYIVPLSHILGRPLANRRACNGCIGMYWDVLVM
jgi:hypothetical protein